MTVRHWRKLRQGSIIKSARSGVFRRVLSVRNGCVILTMIQGGKRRLWCGRYRHNIKCVSKTVYVTGDCAVFSVYRY